jgi:hypothetical protein
MKKRTARLTGAQSYTLLSVHYEHRLPHGCNIRTKARLEHFGSIEYRDGEFLTTAEGKDRLAQPDFAKRHEIWRRFVTTAQQEATP